MGVWKQDRWHKLEDGTAVQSCLGLAENMLTGHRMKQRKYIGKVLAGEIRRRKRDGRGGYGGA
jgi:hypothetical protein